MRWSPPREALPSTRVGGRNDWQTLRMLLPYLWAYRGRVLFALACLLAAKLATVSVPILLKSIVDALSPAAQGVAGVLVVPVALVVAYGLLRLSTSLFTELREFFFVNVTQAAMRTLALKTFRHLHSLSLRYHLERRTGAVTREIDHGIRGISSLISFTLYSILPTLIEITLVVAYLVWHYEVWFAAIVGVSLTLYIVFTVSVTNWRTVLRRRWNELETKAQSRAVDSLLNFETVKYFGNEDYEARRYDETLAASQRTRSDVAAVAQRAELRAAADHRDRADADPLARGRGRGRGPHDDRRPGAGQRLHDPALHPAQLPRRHLPRDQAEPDGHGPHVLAARPEPRDRRRARRPAACDTARRSALRARRFRLRLAAARAARR